jgi:hypothetical protein
VLWLETFTLLGCRDASAQSVAWYAKIARAIQEVAFPFGDFQTDSGNYFPGELQTATFYPLAWLFALVFEPGKLKEARRMPGFFILLRSACASRR